MKQELSFTLELLAEGADYLLFRLVFRNDSAVKLLLPYPEIHGLRFANKATMLESEWYTCLLVSAEWGGFMLVPGQEKSIEYRVRPCIVERPEENDHSDYYRWCVDLSAGHYLVWFRFEVDENYFCPDSHYRYADLLWEAEQQEAEVWTGQIRSNQIDLVRP